MTDQNKLKRIKSNLTILFILGFIHSIVPILVKWFASEDWKEVFHKFYFLDDQSFLGVALVLLTADSLNLLSKLKEKQTSPN